MKFSFYLFLILTCACSVKKSGLENQTQSGHTELYSEPTTPKKPNDENYKRIIIAATNDIHGHYEPHNLQIKDQHHDGSQFIKVGGVDFISSYFKILRQQYEGQVLLLDSGDIFSDNAQEMKFASDFYSILGYDALTVGLKDFNLKLPSKYRSSADFLKDFSAQSKTPVILSNLYELKTARAVEWSGTLPYLIREVNGVKVGIIGLIPDDLVGLTAVDNRVGLYVESMLQSTLKHSRLLRSLGAEVVVVITHQGVNCGEEIASELKLPISKVNFEPNNKTACDLSSKMGEYLSRLPANLVDVVIGGRIHQKTANIINTSLVMSNFGDGLSFSYAELFVDVKSKKIHHEKTIVHQPVMFCQEFFKETNDCYAEDPTVDHKVRSPALFLGETVSADGSLEQKFHYFLKAKNNTTSVDAKIFQPVLDFYEGHIIYKSSSNQNSKLMLVTLKGYELLNILEDDYNQNLAHQWIPSPFTLEGNSLTLTIQGSSLVASDDYKILASVEDLQNHGQLKKFITRTENKSLHSVSWNDPGIYRKDEISTALSASEAVR